MMVPALEVAAWGRPGAGMVKESALRILEDKGAL
jgi:hypothetical protein